MERLRLAWVWSFFLLLLLLLNCSFHCATGCLDEERNALLELKASINDPGGNALPSWEEDGTDCCSWNHVKCNHSTHRVTEISLRDIREVISYNWYFNATLLLPFQELRSLDLSGNFIVGWTDGKDFQRLSRLIKLEKLDLSFNHLNQRMLPHLAVLKSLKDLRLSNSLFGGPPLKDFRWLSGFTKLEKFDLSDNALDQTMLPYLAALKSLKDLRLSNNEFDGLVPLKELSTFSKLEALDLSYQYSQGNKSFIGPIPPVVESLISLNMSGNALNDSESIQGLCKLKNLQELRLSQNQFDGNIPLCLGNLRNLQVLDLSGNQFNGKIPASLISNLTSLVYLSLADNRFSGSFMLSSLAHFSKLKGIELKNNNGLKVETEYPPWVPTFQLEVISLSKCQINRPTSVIPSFLYNQYNLTHVDLSHNQLQGDFPTWLIENNARLKLLNLRNNSLRGTFLLSHNISLKDLIYLDISKNHISGHLPINIDILFPNAEVLNMSSNAFQGSMPPSLRNMRQLQVLDLSYNNLSGELSEHLFANCHYLSLLKLSNNRLSGLIHPTYSNLTNLGQLYLDNNLFTGSILPTLFDNSLVELNVEDNHLSGRLPSQIGNATLMSLLNLGGNHFEGPIPFEICRLNRLEFLDLSRNNLHGSVQSISNLSSLRYLYLENNEFSGFNPSAPLERSSLVTIDVRYNSITGSLPSWISGPSDLKALLMKGNYLQGPIPIELCQLKNLNILDLSNNNLSGSMPSCINSLAFGRATNGHVEFHVDDPVVLDYSEVSSLIPYLNGEGLEAATKAIDVQVEFVTKSRSDSYKGDIIQYMSGIDLSCNQLTGEIPLEIGQLINLRALNLSNNRLSGRIPRTLSNLNLIESLDLSYNRLTGTIPYDLVNLNFLAVFKVGYNNLSGPIPDTRQFSTFEEGSYGGNPLLCGPPVKKSCFSFNTPHAVPTQQEEEDNNKDMYFYGSFVGSYCVFLIGTIVVLYYSKR